MILISGTKRSGTSMWMQALHAAGLCVIGESFPKDWSESSLRQANPAGFFESSLRSGVNFMTNPDPETGQYLHPDQTRCHGVKVFLPGLTRTDLSFIYRVVITVRDWRQYCASAARLQALEWESSGVTGEREPTPLKVHALEWWAENFMGLRDVMMRRYPCHAVSYASVLAAPDGVFGETFEWLGVSELDVGAAAAVVRRPAPEPGAAPTPVDLEADLVQVFDDLYGRIDQGIPFDEGFVAVLNTVHTRLTPLIFEHFRQGHLHRQFEERQSGNAP